jgi:hypothetical protein
MPNVLATAQRDPQIVETFQREVRLLASIDHPHIVQCYRGITRMDGGYAMWIVMEKLDLTLFVAIKGNHLQIVRDDPQTYVDLLEGICIALAYLHTPVGGKPIVHRDLKPENIMIMIKSLRERMVKLIDFDMAKQTLAGVGSTISTKGTLEYMAPEVHMNGGCSDRKADTQELLSRCLNVRPEYRPAAAFVSFRIVSFVVPSPDRPSGMRMAEVKGICFHCDNPVYSDQERGRDQSRGYYHTTCVTVTPHLWEATKRRLVFILPSLLLSSRG